MTDSIQKPNGQRLPHDRLYFHVEIHQTNHTFQGVKRESNNMESGSSRSFGTVGIGSEGTSILQTSFDIENSSSYQLLVQQRQPVVLSTKK